MTFLLPLGLALGLTLPVVVAFYLLKVRHREQEVSSTFLWQDAIRDLTAHEPFQKPRWNLLLLLQLLILAGVTVALARPVLEALGPAPENAVLLVDGSASMQATDVTPSRFAQAVEQAKKTLDALPDGSHVSVLLAAGHPQVLVSDTTDRGAARSALDQAAPSSAVNDMGEALVLARALGGDPASRHVYLFTDGAWTTPPDLPSDLGPVVVSQVGSASPQNLAVTAISARPDPQNAQQQQIFARFQNFGGQAVQATATLDVDGQQQEARPISVDPNGTSDQVFTGISNDSQVAQVQIAGTGVSDDLSLDDQATVLLHQHRPSQILLVSNGNPFLQKALALLPNVQLSQAAASTYPSLDVSSFDVVVFDRYVPPALPRANVLLVDPPNSALLPVSATLSQPQVGGWDETSPLLAFADLRDLQVDQAENVTIPSWMRPVVTTSDNAPLLAAGQNGTRRVALFAFDLNSSSLPRSQAFPIVMANLVAYLAPPGTVEDPSIPLSATENVVPLPQASQVQVVAPDGSVSNLAQGHGSLTYTQTNQPGVYRVRETLATSAPGSSGTGAAATSTTQEDLFVANLLSPAESDLRARLAGLDQVASATDALIMRQTDLRPWLAAAALALLLGEWYWYQRRT